MYCVGQHYSIVSLSYFLLGQLLPTIWYARNEIALDIAGGNDEFIMFLNIYPFTHYKNQILYIENNILLDTITRLPAP